MRGGADPDAIAGISRASKCLRFLARHPGAYKDVSAVVAAAEHAGLARRLARLRPMICIKGSGMTHFAQPQGYDLMTACAWRRRLKELDRFNVLLE